MPRAAISPDSLLLSFADAARQLRIDVPRLLRLIDAGHLRPHPILADRIARSQIERFASYDVNDAETDAEIGREMDPGSASPAWDAAPIRLRQVP